MDKWSEVQYKRMKCGGNQAALDFFLTHPDFRNGMPIVEKYNSEFAVFYKEKLAAKVEVLLWSLFITFLNAFRQPRASSD